MSRLSKFLSFVEEKGRPLSEINPGSDEIALKINDAFHTINLLQEIRIPILGGDVLSDESGKLIYTYENWYTERKDRESNEDYTNRSYEDAREYIKGVEKRSGKNRYVVIVI